MSSDEILEIEMAVGGRLEVRPSTEQFPHIYRMANGTRWDEARRCIWIQTDERLALPDWFKLLWRSAAQEYGVRLQLLPDTTWTNIPGEVRDAIESGLPVLNNEHDAILVDQNVNGGARAIRMGIDSLANVVRPKADAAFKAGRYQEASELYLQIQDVLSAPELRRLEIATRRSSSGNHEV